MTLNELHATLRAAYDAVGKVRGKGNVPAGITDDTALAVGHAIGTISTALALVGRDIDGKPPGKSDIAAERVPDEICRFCGYRGPDVCDGPPPDVCERAIAR